MNKRVQSQFGFILFLFITLLLTSIFTVRAEQRTRIVISIYSNSSAKWTLIDEMDLITNEDLDVFNNYSAIIDSNRSSVISDFSSSMLNLVSQASSVTGREMTATNFNVKTSIVGINVKVGVIEYSFLWINFSNLQDRMMVMGDVFQGGFYLYENDTLTVNYPNEFKLKFSSPSPNTNLTNGLVWYGKLDFKPGEPMLVLEDRRLLVSITASKSSLVAGDELVINGQISPAIVGMPIVLTINSPSETKISSLTTLVDGTFRWNLNVNEPGTWVIFATYPGGETYLSSRSQQITINVSEDLYRSNTFRYGIILIILAVVAVSISLYWFTKKKKKTPIEALLTKK